MPQTQDLPRAHSSGPPAPAPVVHERDRRWLLLPALLVLLLVMELALLVVVRAVGHDPTVATLPVTPRVLVITGGGLAGRDALAVAKATVTDLGGQGLAVAHPRAGFASGAVPLSKSAPEDIPGPRLDMVVVQGGENDTAKPAAQVESSAAEMVTTMRETLGEKVRIVVVGPVPGPGGRPTGRAEVREALRRASARTGARYVDPQALGWRSGQPDLHVQLSDVLRDLLPSS